MHQNHLDTQQQSLLQLDPFVADARAELRAETLLPPPPAEAETLAPPPPPTLGDEAQQPDLASPQEGPESATTLLVPPPPPPTLDDAVQQPDLVVSQPQPLPQEGSEAAPTTTTPEPAATTTTTPEEPAATTTTTPEPAATTTTTTILPLIPATTATAGPRPVQAAGSVDAGSSDADQGLQQLSRVLTSLGYNEMAQAAPLLADAPPLARWPGAITVFAAPDAFLQASCPMCSRAHLLVQHIAMGYYPYSELASAATMKIPSASVGLCLKIATERGPFGVRYARVYADGVEVSHPELYNDGRYVVHGLHGFLRPLTHSCFDAVPRSRTSAAASSAASVVRVMLRGAIARLRDGGYGFVALAMRVKFAELERFGNVTLFALDDQGIFVDGGHDYVSAVRFHVVPDHRLTRADLRHLRPGCDNPNFRVII